MEGTTCWRKKVLTKTQLLTASLLVLCMTLTGETTSLAAPTVTGAAPAAGATNVPVTTTITTTFNQDLDPATVTTGSITLSRPAKATAIDAQNQILALREDGTVVAWGLNSSAEASVPAGLTDVRSVSAGWGCSIAVKNDNTVVSWWACSDRYRGSSNIAAIAASGSQLDNILETDGTAYIFNPSSSSYVPIPDAMAVADGPIALKRDGTVIGLDPLPGTVLGTGFAAIAAGTQYLTFSHFEGLKPDGTAYTLTSGTPVLQAEGLTAIAAGTNHTLGLKNDGTVIAWGNNSYGQTTVPDGLTNVTAIAAGGDYSFAIKADGTVVPWGSNGYVGNPAVPSAVTGLTTIAAGDGHGAAIKNDGTVVTWGANDAHQADIPPGLSNVIAIAAGSRHTVALKADGTVVAWGINDSGQSTVPTGLAAVTAVAAGSYHTVALKADGTVAAWGDNRYNQSMVPPDLTNVTAIAADGTVTLALKSDGTVVAWGINVNDTGKSAIVPAELTDVNAIAAGVGFSAALKRDGTLVRWNNWDASTQYNDASNATAIAIGSDHTVALKSDGTVVTWFWDNGSNNYGQATVPPGLSGVTKIAARGNYTYALRADGTIVPFGAYPPVFSPLGPFEAAVPATITYDASSRTATITPAAQLAPNSTYDVKLNTGIRTAAGEYLPADTSWSFTTESRNLKLSIAGGSDLYYNSLNDALAAVSQTSTSTIALRSTELLEDIVLNNCGALVTLKGGYDALFTAISGPTVINGSVTVTCGTLIADNLVIS